MPFDRYCVPGSIASSGPVDDKLSSFRCELAAEYDVQELACNFGGSDFCFLSVRDSYALLDRISHEKFLKDEQMPYWAEVWPAALAFAQYIMESGELAGRSVIELGAGLGVASIAAARSGARVLVTDYSTAALKFVAYNALRNRVALDTCRLDWRMVKGSEKFDAVIAADVLYERVNLLPIVMAIDALLTERGAAWIADPRRRLAKQFLELVQENGFRISEQHMLEAEGDQAVGVTIYKLERGSA